MQIENLIKFAGADDNDSAASTDAYDKNKPCILVTMLGNFVICEHKGDANQAKQLSSKTKSAAAKTNDKEISTLISDLTGRSRRLWTIIAYLIFHRNRGVSSAELIDLLWPDASVSDPQARLQNNISRARAVLSNDVFEDPRDLICFENGLYWWAPKQQTILDVDVFENLIKSAGGAVAGGAVAGGESAGGAAAGGAVAGGKSAGMTAADAASAIEISPDMLDQALQICDLYQGDFLSQASEETWSVNLNIYYRSLYISFAQKVLSALRAADRTEDIKALCHKVINIEPTIEEFNIALMDALIAEGSPQKAIDHYTHIKNLFDTIYGVQVSPEIEVYRNLAMEALYGTDVSKDAIMEYFDDENENDGAFYCNTATFREIVQLHSRLIERREETSQLIALEFVTPMNKAVLSAKRLEKVIQQTLRAGDPFTKMGRNLFLCLLPTANDEAAKSIAQRIINNYEKEFPFAKIPFNFWAVDLKEF